ncbi:MAG: hypothetical protein A2516_00940 [Alphaproteobacteria bacterium RIFOXYD12_FULL_60_8]|nr:MAG: hypothetical protein A2516_00940 [Alphaproteobacteria bacterium RIFOXYD12_FULL_60_8]
MRGSLVVLTASLLGGCTVPSAIATPTSGMPTLGIVEAASLINTDKTIGDHILSYTSGKDCSTLRSQDGGEYCVTIEKYVPPEPQPTYCYESLGSVNCYSRPLQGANDHYLGSTVK